MKFSGKVWMTMGRPDYIFGKFRETARCRDAKRGDGVCCAFAPQLIFNMLPIGWPGCAGARDVISDVTNRFLPPTLSYRLRIVTNLVSAV